MLFYQEEHLPQGSWLGPLIFIILIDDLRPSVLTHKYLDDTTLTEIILRDTASEMQHVADAMMEWSEANHMNVNVKKTKEMVLGRIGKESVLSLIHI